MGAGSSEGCSVAVASPGSWRRVQASSDPRNLKGFRGIAEKSGGLAWKTPKTPFCEPRSRPGSRLS